MKELSKMQARNLRIELNKGTGMKSLCAIYGASEKEIESRIRRLYNQSGSVANDFIAQLYKNDTKRRKRKNNNTATSTLVEETKAAEIEVEEEILSEEMTPNLAELQKQAKSLSDEVMGIEVKHEGLRTRRSKLKDEMGELSNRLTQLRKQIVGIGADYRIKAEEFNQIAEEMSSLSEKKALKIGKLDELNANIMRLQTIELFIYNDGNVAVGNRSDIVLNDNGYEPTYEEFLRSDKDYLDLKKSQLMVLAKVVCIINNLGRDANIELLFDDEIIERAYYQLTA